MRHWKDAQTAREKLESEFKSGKSFKEQRRATSRDQNMSSRSSLTDHQVPPPPPMDVPTIDEILHSNPDNIGTFNSLDSSIPPPPPVEAPLAELLESSKSRAFEQEQGQFLCHVYVAVNIEATTEVLGDIVELVEAEQCRSQERAFRDWKVVKCESGTNNQFHVTLLRGHRVIYHHQIEPLLSGIESEIKTSTPLSVCLDKLKLFHNHEQTKQFLCIATRETNQASEVVELMNLKLRLRNAIDQFATRMTEEDESHDTLPHCSLMCRDVQQVEQSDLIDEDLKKIENLCEENLQDYPVCIVQVGTIYIKIGNHIYSFQLPQKLN